MPDLLSESMWTVSGRYKGNFPDTIQVTGIFADSNNFVADLNVQKAKEIPLDRVRFQPMCLFLQLCPGDM